MMTIGGGCHTIARKRSDQKIIVLEGPDGCGKTNIGHGLTTELKIPYFKVNSEADNWRKGRFKEALEFDQTYILQFLQQTGYDVIIDRAWPSEWVYSQVYRRETNMTLLEKIDREHSKLGTTIVMPVRRDYSKNRHDDLVDNGMLPALHDKYMEFMEWTHCSVVSLFVDDYKDNLKRELEVILPELHFDEHDFRFKVLLSREERKIGFGKGKML